MNPFTASLIALALALFSQACITGWCCELLLRRGQAAGVRLIWGALAAGGLVLALHHGYTLELALRAGLYDFRQAVLAAFSGVLFAAAVFVLRRRQA